jgi:hypothetical protein
MLVVEKLEQLVKGFGVCSADAFVFCYQSPVLYGLFGFFCGVDVNLLEVRW